MIRSYHRTLLYKKFVLFLEKNAHDSNYANSDRKKSGNCHLMFNLAIVIFKSSYSYCNSHYMITNVKDIKFYLL